MSAVCTLTHARWENPVRLKEWFPRFLHIKVCLQVGSRERERERETHEALVTTMTATYRCVVSLQSVLAFTSGQNLEVTSRCWFHRKSATTTEVSHRDQDWPSPPHKVRGVGPMFRLELAVREVWLSKKRVMQLSLPASCLNRAIGNFQEWLDCVALGESGAQCPC